MHLEGQNIKCGPPRSDVDALQRAPPWGEESQVDQHSIRIFRLSIRNVTPEAQGAGEIDTPGPRAKILNQTDQEIIMSAFIESRITLVLATAMLLACAWGGTRVLADEAVRTERVSFKDLNLETPEGVQALYGRIHAAAKRVCSQFDSVYKSAETACASKAESQAIESLHLVQLTAYYQMKTKPSGSRQLVAAR